MKREPRWDSLAEFAALHDVVASLARTCERDVGRAAPRRAARSFSILPSLARRLAPRAGGRAELVRMHGAGSIAARDVEVRVRPFARAKVGGARMVVLAAAASDVADREHEHCEHHKHAEHNNADDDHGEGVISRPRRQQHRFSRVAA
ncbi:hypothetical protein [Nannocystis punicea]|uniref:Uncharacterized protein n=1 Tax=Nannocystis punicea TaxID=2995304 RepID=A0ABY7HA67_9BACT|nr:hypothetical protein [Nannocystis poenicansa]WAS96178.1 hypothetical protein O0S08_08445 [Nannocystis poenicansa]